MLRSHGLFIDIVKFGATNCSYVRPSEDNRTKVGRSKESSRLKVIFTRQLLALAESLYERWAPETEWRKGPRGPPAK